MIDKTQPPPGWVPSDEIDGGAYCPSIHTTMEHAHLNYAEESRPAVVDFAESVRSFLILRAEQLEKHGDNSAGAELRYRAGEILAAARGERSLP